MTRSTFFIALVCAALMLLVSGLLIARGASGPFDDLGRIAVGLAIVMTVALGGGHLASRAGQPAVLGELLAGVLLGNLPGLERLQFLGSDQYLDILSRIGMLLLMFEVGIDLSVRDLFAVGPSSLLVAFVGTTASLVTGMGAAAFVMPAAPTFAHVFLGAAITATSIGITARVLKDLGAARSREARIILGAAVVDDVLALVVLGVVAASVSADPRIGFRPIAIAGLVMKTVGFLTLAIVLGVRWTPSWFRQAARLRTNGALLAVGLCFCFFLSWAASAIGLAALVGAFAAGLVLEDTHSEMFVRRGERPLNELLQPMTSFLVPVFFVLVGFRTNAAALPSLAALTLPVVLTVAAVLGKLSAAAGVVNAGVNRWTVAAGMIPRGEVTLVFAALGGTLRVAGVPLLDARGYAALVTVVIVTTLVTPVGLRWSMRRRATPVGIVRGSS